MLKCRAEQRSDPKFIIIKEKADDRRQEFMIIKDNKMKADMPKCPAFHLQVYVKFQWFSAKTAFNASLSQGDSVVS